MPARRIGLALLATTFLILAPGCPPSATDDDDTAGDDDDSTPAPSMDPMADGGVPWSPSTTDVDLGFGYHYDAWVEDAKLLGDAAP